MKLCIRAHDLGAKGTDAILQQLDTLGLDGVQMVCYKAYDQIPYAPGGIARSQAEEIGRAFQAAGKSIPLVGAYFNPVHSDAAKVKNGVDVFADYLRCCQAMGCNAVGSETGSFHDEPWVYHPRNRTQEALQSVVGTFAQLCDVAADCGSTVAMEGAAGHVCWDVATLAKARKMIGRPTKVIFDLYNYLDAANQADYLQILEQGLDAFAGDILLFHLKDCRLKNRAAPEQVPFGAGDLDVEAILRRIRAYDTNAVLTLEGTTGAHIAQAVHTIKAIWGRDEQ